MPDLTIERLQLFLLIVFPGILAIKVHDLFYPPQKRDFGSSLLEAATYGLINFGIWVWPLLYINQADFAKNHAGWYTLGSFVFLVASPILLACLLAWARTWPLVTKWIGWPNKSAWDDFFKKSRESWVLFHLKSGKMLGGYYGEQSYATSFPDEPEIYVEEVWRVDENGHFVEKVDGTFGMILKQAECERLEFLEVEPQEVSVEPEHQQRPCEQDQQGGDSAGQNGRPQASDQHAKP